MDVSKLDTSTMPPYFLNMNAEHFNIPLNLPDSQKINAIDSFILVDYNPATLNSIIKLSTLFFRDYSSFRIEEDPALIKIFYNPAQLTTLDDYELIDENGAIYVDENSDSYITREIITNGFNFTLMLNYIAAGVDVQLNAIGSNSAILVDENGAIYVDEINQEYEVL